MTAAKWWVLAWARASTVEQSIAPFTRLAQRRAERRAALHLVAARRRASGRTPQPGTQTFPVALAQLEDLAVVRDLRARGFTITEAADVREEDEDGRVRWRFVMRYARALALLVAGMLSSWEPAHADRRIDPALVLARLCVSEAGWDCFDRLDGYAIHETTLERAARMAIDYSTAAQLHSPRLFGRRPRDAAIAAMLSELEGIDR